MEIDSCALEKKFKEILSILGYVDWDVIWVSDSSSLKRGEIQIKDKIIILYDESPSQAWDTFFHEIIELKLREVINPHRKLVNVLIDFIQDHIYVEKERTIGEFQFLISIMQEFSQDNSYANEQIDTRREVPCTNLKKRSQT